MPTCTRKSNIITNVGSDDNLSTCFEQYVPIGAEIKGAYVLEYTPVFISSY